MSLKIFTSRRRMDMIIKGFRRIMSKQKIKNVKHYGRLMRPMSFCNNISNREKWSISDEISFWNKNIAFKGNNPHQVLCSPNKSYNIALAKGAILWAFYTQDPEFYILLCFYSHSLLSSGEIYCLFWKINQNFIKFHPGWFIYIKYKLYNICHSVVFSSQEMHVLYYGSKIWQLLNEISFRVFKIKLRASSFHWTSDNFDDFSIDFKGKIDIWIFFLQGSPTVTNYQSLNLSSHNYQSLSFLPKH